MDKNRNAFTLIEVLVVTVITLLLSGTSLALFSSYRDDRMLNKEVQQFISILELAKSKSAASDVSLCSENATAHVTGYQVVLNSTAHTLSLSPSCDTIPTPFRYTISSSITYVPAVATLQFLSGSYQGHTTRFVLKNTTTSHCKYAEITETGLVTNGDITCP